MTDALELFKLLRLHDQLKDLFDNEDEELVLDPLIEVLHVVELAILLTLLEILDNHRRVEYLIVLIPK